MSAVVLALPSGACDCHTHVVGNISNYSMVGERQYTPPPAPHESLLDHLKRNGLQRVVIIQPSFYGSDNSCMINSLSQLQGAGRGIAVLNEDIDNAALSKLHEAGIRGIRINIESAGDLDPKLLAKQMRQWAKRIAPLNWHIQIYVNFRTIAAAAAEINSLEVPVVLDHFAMVPANTNNANEEFIAILDLLSKGNVYIKLSAPYRIAEANPIEAAANLAHTFIATNPERILWGSDWPHTNREPGKSAHEVSQYRNISPHFLLNSIEQWMPSTSLRQQVLVINPSQLYDF